MHTIFEPTIMAEKSKVLAEPFNQLDSADWYQGLLEELRAVIVETQFWASVEFIKGKWLLGNIILENEDLAQRRKVYGKRIVEKIAEDLKIKARELWRCIQFAKRFPGLVNEEKELSLEPFEEGKNITWRIIYRNYLPEPIKERGIACDHLDIEEVRFYRCIRCREPLGGKTKELTQKERLEVLEAWDKKKKS